MRIWFPLISIVCLSLCINSKSHAQHTLMQMQWPKTDFSKTTVDLSSIHSGGLPRDGIPAIDNPGFEKARDVTNLSDKEPVIQIVINGRAKAYPIQILMWHEIVNDRIGDIPVVVTYCPMCNTSVAFRRDVTVDGRKRLLDFGVTGKLRHSDLIMYDRQTESWWQQFSGDAIAGDFAGSRLEVISSRVVPFAEFKTVYPDGNVLKVTENMDRPYGINPYAGYDLAETPMLFTGATTPAPIKPMEYLVAVGREAWPLVRLRQEGRILHNDLILTWYEGMNSALGARKIKEGRDIGFVQVQRKTIEGDLKDTPHLVTFAFAFHAFEPDGIVYFDKNKRTVPAEKSTCTPDILMEEIEDLQK